MKQRMHAKGPRGEAVVIIKTGDQDEELEGSFDASVAYWLASGERLAPTEDPRVFQAKDGRHFTLV